MAKPIIPIFSKKPKQVLVADPNTNSIGSHGSYTERNIGIGTFQKESDLMYGETPSSKSSIFRSTFQQENKANQQVTSTNTRVGNQMTNKNMFKSSASKPRDMLFSRNKPYTQANSAQNNSDRKGTSGGYGQSSLRKNIPASNSTSRPNSGYGTNRLPTDKPCQGNGYYENRTPNQAQNSWHMNKQKTYPQGGGQPSLPSPAKGWQAPGNAFAPESRSYGNRPTSTASHNRENGNNLAIESKPTTKGNAEDMKMHRKDTLFSARIVTTTLQGLKHWSTSTNRLPLTFEIYGRLNSNVSSEKYQCGKRFILQDDSDVVKCLFFEVDRRLPNLQHGQLYRCVGKWCASESYFQCLSVRPVLDDERKVYKLRINASERAMRAWKLKNSEF